MKFDERGSNPKPCLSVAIESSCRIRSKLLGQKVDLQGKVLKTNICLDLIKLLKTIDSQISNFQENDAVFGKLKYTI